LGKSNGENRSDCCFKGVSNSQSSSAKVAKGIVQERDSTERKGISSRDKAITRCMQWILSGNLSKNKDTAPSDKATLRSVAFAWCGVEN
jgi:hypothetical protein